MLTQAQACASPCYKSSKTKIEFSKKWLQLFDYLKVLTITPKHTLLTLHYLFIIIERLPIKSLTGWSIEEAMANVFQFSLLFIVNVQKFRLSQKATCWQLEPGYPCIMCAASRGLHTYLAQVLTYVLCSVQERRTCVHMKCQIILITLKISDRDLKVPFQPELSLPFYSNLICRMNEKQWKQ